MKVIKFEAQWCKPCALMNPVVNALKKEGIDFEVVDTDKHPDLAKEYAVTTVPTFVKVVDDAEEKRFLGLMNINQFRDWLNSQ